MKPYSHLSSFSLLPLLLVVAIHLCASDRRRSRPDVHAPPPSWLAVRRNRRPPAPAACLTLSCCRSGARARASLASAPLLFVVCCRPRGPAPPCVARSWSSMSPVYSIGVILLLPVTPPPSTRRSRRRRIRRMKLEKETGRWETSSACLACCFNKLC